MTNAPTLFIVTGRFLKSAEIIAEATPRHRAWLDGQYRAGVLLLSGRHLDQRGGTLLARAHTQAALEEVFAADPFVVEGIAQYTYQGFTPTKRGEAVEIEGVPLVN